jgi:hypothetical protein
MRAPNAARVLVLGEHARRSRPLAQRRLEARPGRQRGESIQYPFTAGTPEGGAIGEAHNNGRPELMKTMGHFLFSLFRWGIEEDHCVLEN